MKTVYLALGLAFVSLITHAQKPSIQWGDEFKLRKGSTDLGVVAVDKTGAYLQESHPALKSYFVVGATLRESASLVKIDNNLKEVYRNDFNKELRGKEFEQFVPFDDKLYLFSSEYSKRDRTLTVYASGINKDNGELTGAWKQVATYVQDEKADDINFKIAYNVDSTKLLVISSIEKSKKNEYRIQELGKNLKANGKPLLIKNQFETNTYQLEDVLYTIERKVILVGRMYQYEEGKKKKEKFLNFTNYNIRIFNDKGKQETEINTSINSKWLVSTKLLQEKNKDLILTAFYSNKKKGSIDGLLVQRINVNDGKVISTSEKAINNSLLSADQENTGNEEEEDKEESKEERKMRAELNKMKNEGEGFSKHMKFRHIFYTPDNGLLILAEYFEHYVTTSTSFNTASHGMPASTTTRTYDNYISKDLMMCKIDASGNIAWLQVLPKNQREMIYYPGHTTYGSGLTYSTNYFINANMPYYSGFGAIQSGNTIHILLNDNAKNATVVQAGQKASTTVRFGKTDCYILNLDAGSGKISRKTFFSNKDIPTAMPRLGAVIGNEMYMVGKSDKMIGKTKIAVAKITMDL